MIDKTTHFAGFWRRTLASLIDVVILIVLTFPLLYWIYGPGFMDDGDFIRGPADFLISFVIPAIATVALWLRVRGTPGKMALKSQVVDAETGGTITLRQAVIRYFGYFLSLIPLGLGYFWVAFDARKQSWHDKLARTVVVVTKSQSK
jgi:uncharacterized RDD family membrane protein YckC